MNEGMHNFKLWFDGFCAAKGRVADDGLDPFQWEALRRQIELLTLDPDRIYAPGDAMTKYGRLVVPKDAPSSMSGDNGVGVPRYPDEKPL